MIKTAGIGAPVSPAATVRLRSFVPLITTLPSTPDSFFLFFHPPLSLIGICRSAGSLRRVVARDAFPERDQATLGDSGPAFLNLIGAFDRGPNSERTISRVSQQPLLRRRVDRIPVPGAISEKFARNTGVGGSPARVHAPPVYFRSARRVIKPIISAARRRLTAARYLGISRAHARLSLSNSRRVTKLYTRPAVGYGRNRPDAVDAWAVYRPVILRYLVNRQREDAKAPFAGPRRFIRSGRALGSLNEPGRCVASQVDARQDTCVFDLSRSYLAGPPKITCRRTIVRICDPLE